MKKTRKKPEKKKIHFLRLTVLFAFYWLSEILGGGCKKKKDSVFSSPFHHVINVHSHLSKHGPCFV